MWVRYRLSIVLAYCEILDGATLMQLPAVSAPLLRPLGVYFICNCKCNCNSNTQPQTKAHRYSRRRLTEGSFHFHFHFAIGLIHEPNLISRTPSDDKSLLTDYSTVGTYCRHSLAPLGTATRPTNQPAASNKSTSVSSK